MPYVVAQPCVDVKDKACVDECPVDCIYEGSRSLYINPNECVDCGACEPVCQGMRWAAFVLHCLLLRFFLL